MLPVVPQKSLSSNRIVEMPINELSMSNLPLIISCSSEDCKLEVVKCKILFFSDQPFLILLESCYNNTHPSQSLQLG